MPLDAPEALGVVAVFREMTDDEYIASIRKTRLSLYERRCNQWLAFQAQMQREVGREDRFV